MTKRQKELIGFIDHQLSISLFNKVSERMSSRKYITIETDDISDNDLRLVEYLGDKSDKYTIEPNGHKKIAIRLNNK